MLQHGLWGASQWIGVEVQKAALIELGIAGKRLGGPNERDWFINQKTRSNDRIAVYRLFAIASSVGELQDCVARAHDRGIYFDEIAEKPQRRSDDTRDLLKMMQEAQLAYAGRWLDPKRASEMGLRARGVDINGEGKFKRMPNAEAEVFLNDHSLTVTEALFVINSDKRYNIPWTRNYVYRQRRKGRLKLEERHNGKNWN